MIRIYKGDNQKLVTKGAYETFYKPLGYKIVLENKSQKIAKKDEETKVQLNNVVRPNKRTRRSSNKKNYEVE